MKLILTEYSEQLLMALSAEKSWLTERGMMPTFGSSSQESSGEFGERSPSIVNVLPVPVCP